MLFTRQLSLQQFCYQIKNSAKAVAAGTQSHACWCCQTFRLHQTLKADTKHSNEKRSWRKLSGIPIICVYRNIFPNRLQFHSGWKDEKQVKLKENYFHHRSMTFLCMTRRVQISRFVIISDILFVLCSIAVSSFYSWTAEMTWWAEVISNESKFEAGKLPQRELLALLIWKGSGATGVEGKHLIPADPLKLKVLHENFMLNEILRTWNKLWKTCEWGKRTKWNVLQCLAFQF